MKIKVTYEKIFDAVEYTMSDDWKDCSFEEFKDYLCGSFQKYPNEIIDAMIFEEIEEVNDSK